MRDEQLKIGCVLYMHISLVVSSYTHQGFFVLCQLQRVWLSEFSITVHIVTIGI